MPAKRITEEDYRLTVAAFREDPGVFSSAAKATGLTPRFVKKLWEKGFKRGTLVLPPIKSFLLQEDKKLQSQIIEMTKREEVRLLDKWERTREQAVQNHIKYGETIQEVLTAASENIQIIKRSGATMSNLADLAASGIGALTEITPKEALFLISTYTKTLVEFVDGMKKLQELASAHYGDPQKIVQVNVTHSTEAMSTEQLLADIEQAAAEAKQLRGSIDAGKLEAAVDVIIPEQNAEH